MKELKKFLPLLLENKDKILQQWLNIPKVQKFLKIYKIDTIFKNRYAKNILEYYFDIIKGTSQIGQCPSINQMLKDFLELEIPPHELHNLCTNFKKTMVNITYDLNINNQTIYNEMITIIDLNIEGVLKEYTNILKYKNDEIENLSCEILNNQKEMVFRLGELGELRSKETGEHVKRVSLYSKELAKLCNLTTQEIDFIEHGSPMHDLGKLGIPDAILNKHGKLSLDEFTTMQTHAELGYKILSNSKTELMQYASIIAYEHHEKWDGTGYPRGISGEEIHIAGRITAIADVFDALGEKRVYKKAWSNQEIYDFFLDEKGRHFDPELVDLFLENFETFVAIRDKHPDKEEEGIVVIT